MIFYFRLQRLNNKNTAFEGRRLNALLRSSSGNNGCSIGRNDEKCEEGQSDCNKSREHLVVNQISSKNAKIAIKRNILSV
jgi:hypothetical protein